MMEKKKVILLIEDNPDDVDLTLRAFEKNKSLKVINEMVVVRDGQEALDCLFGAGKYLWSCGFAFCHPSRSEAPQGGWVGSSSENTGKRTHKVVSRRDSHLVTTGRGSCQGIQLWGEQLRTEARRF